MTPDRYSIVTHGGRWLVIDLPNAEHRYGVVVAECALEAMATKTLVALRARFPHKEAEADGR